jgi:hypothetical protein
MIHRIPGGLAPEVEPLDSENPSDFLESGACERLHILLFQGSPGGLGYL